MECIIMEGDMHIFESPDKGKTVYKRDFGSEERELIINAKSLTDVGMSSKEARHKINELIRGIDKCIAQLNL